MEEAVLGLVFNKDLYLRWKTQNGVQLLKEDLSELDIFPNDFTIHQKEYTENCIKGDLMINNKNKEQKDKTTGIDEHALKSNKIRIRQFKKSVGKVKCQFCQYSVFSVFKSAGHMKTHVKTIHDQINDHKCSSCMYSTGKLSNLKRHKSAVHKKITPFKCSFCKFAAISKSDKNRHINTVHDPIKFYKRDKKSVSKVKVKCQFCQYSVFSAFKSAGNMKTHVKTMHDQINDHKCSSCMYSTGALSNLKRHKSAVHKEIRALKCGLGKFTAISKTDKTPSNLS